MPRVLDKLLKLYQIRPGESLPQILAFNDSTADLFGSMVSGDLMYHHQDRRARYIDYESMDWTGGYAHVALDTYADEATSPDPATGRTVWVTAKDKDVKEEVEELLELIHIEDKINAIARSIAKHGEVFAYPIIAGEEGIEDLIYLPPSTVDLVLHPGTGKPAGYNCSALRLMGSAAAADAGVGAAPGNVVRDGTAVYSPWDIVQFRLTSSDLTSNYGSSMLEAARSTWRELQMLETSVVIYRVHKTGQKFIFYIDVGEASPDEARQHAERWMRSISKNRYLQVTKDPAAGGGSDQLGRYLERYRPFSMHDDIYWPVRKDSASKIDSFAVSGDISAIEDVEHFTSKLRTSFRIPKAFFDGDISGWGANLALSQQDIQFARQIIKLQRAIKQGLTRLALLHLICREDDIPEFEIHMQSPSNLLELQELDVMTKRSATAAEWMGLADTFGFDKRKWALRVLPKTLGLSEDEIRSLIDPAVEPKPVQTAPDSSDASDEDEGSGAGMSPSEMLEMKEAIKQRMSEKRKVTIDRAKMENPHGFLAEDEGKGDQNGST